MAAHTLAETFAVLSTLPLSPRIGPAAAWNLVHRNVEAHAQVVALTGREYGAVLRDLAELGISGGAIYDGLIARAAEKAEADRFVTLNPDDFRRVWPSGASRIAGV